eukprot:PhM_4_TR14792/c0_g1_i1/m.48045
MSALLIHTNNSPTATNGVVNIFNSSGGLGSSSPAAVPNGFNVSPSGSMRGRPISVVGGRFTLLAKVGAGSFGEVFVARDNTTNLPCTAKVQKAVKHSQLHKEYVVYKELHRVYFNAVGFAQVLYYGVEGDFEVMVMELLGPSLEEIFNHCNRCLSAATVLTLGEQLLLTLERVHALGFLHRDLKPSNCVMGRGSTSHYVHLIDFGLCSRYVRSNGRHVDIREERPFVGTTRFCSLNVHLGVETSRRDDLESLGYVLMYLYLGGLPWQAIKATTKETMRRLVMECKVSSVDNLLQQLPPCLADFVTTARRAGFESVPEYAKWRDRFRKEVGGHFEVLQYDWEVDPLMRSTSAEAISNGSRGYTSSPRAKDGGTERSGRGGVVPSIEPLNRSK